MGKIFAGWAAMQWLSQRRYRLIMKHFQNLQSAWECGEVCEFQKAGLIDKEAIEICQFKKNIEPRQELELLQKNNIELLFHEDKTYSSLLKELPDAPVFLYAKGNTNVLKNRRSLAIVGTRKYSSYGRRVTQEMAEGLTDYNFCIVSGLALGIDSIAHQETLKHEGQTIAVLGSGLNKVYPMSNYHLAQNIIAKGGLIVSEYHPLAECEKFYFPCRNRIIAGLTKATVVIEAGEKSGAIITARLALEYNREVFAVPGSVYHEKSIGTNRIISSGEARLIMNYKEILSELNFGLSVRKKDVTMMKTENEVQQKILEAIVNEGGVSGNELIREIGENAGRVMSELTMMEMRGMVSRVGEKWVVSN